MKKKNSFMKLTLILLLFVVMTFAFNINVYATEHGSGDYCLNFNVDYENGFSQSNVTSIKVGNFDWVNGDIYYNNVDENHNLWTLTIIAGMNGNEYPFVSTPGGLVIDDVNDANYPGYGTYTAIPNPDDDENITGDEFLFTVTLKDSWSDKGDQNHCGGYGVTITSGPPIEEPSVEVTSNVSITIKGEELEYHFDSEHLDEADVAYFKFDINGGTEEARLVPFTFRNAEYTYIDGLEPPKNVSQVTTREDIAYKYQYNNSGYVEFCVNGGGTDEYTSIKINDVDYSQYAPHTKEKYWEAMSGWAQMFCIPNVPYSTRYVVVVEGRDTADENKVPGFGWSYLSADRSEGLNPNEEGNFAHGRLEFVSASLEIDGEEEIFGSARSFDNYRYHGKGQIFQWRDGLKEYPEEDRRMAWGEAQLPYGTKIRVRIIPDEGYQLTGLAVSENGFKATETPGEYELTLTRTNLSYNEDQNQFNLNPTFERVDATAISEANAVSNVTITITGNNNSFRTGTPKLEVTDVASMSPAREEDFNSATAEGYTINNYLEISLYNAIYKGGKKEGNKFLSWDTEVHELENNATIGLELEEDLGGNDVKVIHEVRDAENKITGYDLIDAQYDRNNNTVTFETDGFSTYAIAVRKTNNEEQFSDKVVVDFDTRGGTTMSPIELMRGEKLARPADPENGKHTFEGWFTDPELHDEYDFNSSVNSNLILYAKWSEDNEENHGDEEDKNTSFTITDEEGNEISFKEHENGRFSLTVLDYLSITPEELEQLTGGQVSQEEYNALVNEIKDTVKGKGKLLAFYEVVVTGKNDQNEDYNVDRGNFNIKIRVPENLENFSNYYLTFIDIDDNNNITKGEIVKLSLSKDKKYLVGTLPHLSKWALTGTNSSGNPQTNDNIGLYISLFGLSTLGLIGSGLYLKKKEN